MIGRLLNRRYRIESAAGSGGMADVFKARDELDGAFVAVKVARSDLMIGLERFRREARLLADVRHPAIVRYVDFGTTLEGQSFLVTDWVEGETLKQRLAAFALDVAETLTLGVRLAEGLGELHARGVVHRDVKPSNVVLRDGRVQEATLLDFGIAREIVDLAGLTQTGTTIGTPGFMAPEQLRGDRDVDARADVFALGVILYRCLTASAPFVGRSPVALMMSALLDKAPRASALQPKTPEALDDLVARMLSASRDERPVDARAVLRELLDIEAPALSVALASQRGEPALTSTEQRLECLIFVERSAVLDDATRAEDATLVEGTPLPPVHAIAELHGARVRLATGGLLIEADASDNIPDLALRMGRCALSLASLDPTLRMALVTGRAQTRGGEDPKGIPLGARALLEQAERGEIALDHPTRGLLQGRLLLEARPFGAVLRGEGASPPSLLLGRESPFVGRDTDLATLTALFEQIESEQVARVAAVLAPAGGGKSRLLRELLRTLGGRPQVWMARADPLTAGATYHLLSQLVMDASRDLDPSPTRARLVHSLREMCGSLEGAHAALEGQLALADQVRFTFEDLVKLASERGPVALILEDLHWGDSATVRVVDALVRTLRDRPVFVLVLARPEARQSFPTFWGQDRLTLLELRELGARAGAAIVRHALGDTLPAARVAELVERSGGNPFYLEELVRAQASGASGALPETALGLVGGRFAELDAETRRVLRAASLVGRVFWRSALVTLLGPTAPERLLDTALSTLLELEIIVRRAVGRFPLETEYSFRHALLRDAAYATLTPKDATLGHRLAGQWLEQRNEPNAAVIATHCQLGDDPTNAARMFARAAQQAIGGDDLKKVVELAMQGLACAPSGETLGLLESALMTAHGYLGDGTAAARHGEVAMRLLPPGYAGWFEAAGYLARTLAHLARLEELEGLTQRFLATPAADEHAKGARFAALGMIYVQLLREDRRTHLQEVVAQLSTFSPEDGDVLAASWVYRARAGAAIRGQDYSTYLQWTERAMDACARLGDLRAWCSQLGNAAFGYLVLGLLDMAIERLETAVASAERLGARPIAALSRVNLAVAWAHKGELDKALGLAREAIEVFHQCADPALEGGSYLELAMILRLKGELAESEKAARTGLAICSLLRVQANGVAVLARTLVAAGRPREALETIRATGVPLDHDEAEAEMRLGYAEALAATGAKEEARAALAIARRRVLERADKITDPEHRRSYLTNVPLNVETLALAIEP